MPTSIRPRVRIPIVINTYFAFSHRLHGNLVSFYFFEERPAAGFIVLYSYSFRYSLYFILRLFKNTFQTIRVMLAWIARHSATLSGDTFIFLYRNNPFFFATARHVVKGSDFRIEHFSVVRANDECMNYWDKLAIND